ncbi:WD40 repeat-like protein [Pleurotus pulmonarius]
MEDIQPNEIRHVRKGGPAVAPVVQAASSRVFRRPDGDHESRNERRLHANSDWQTPVDNRATSVHPMSSDIGPNLRSASIIQDQDHLAKRRKLSHSNQQYRDRPTQFDVLLDLPSDCVPGVPGCRDRRRKWVDAQIATIRRERDAIVYMHTLRGLRVIFSCRSLASSPGCEPDAQKSEKSDPISSLTLPNLPLPGFQAGLVSSQRSYVNFEALASDSLPSAFRNGSPPIVSSTALLPDYPSKFRSGILRIKPLIPTSPATSLPPVSTTSSEFLAFDHDAHSEISLSDSPSPAPAASVEIKHEIEEETVKFALKADAVEESTPALYDLDVKMNAQIMAQPHEKARRLLIDEAGGSGYNISTHGSIDLLDIIPSFRQTQLAVSPEPLSGTIDDACLLVTHDADCIVLAHSGQSPQISLVALFDNDKPFSVHLDRPWEQARKSGVGTVAALPQEHAFVSGGHDRIIHLWNVDNDLKSAQLHTLAIKHTSLITSLLPVDNTGPKLISASADCSVQYYDFSSEKTISTIKVSNPIYHVHATDSPFCSLLEIGHRELQFEVRDHRMVPEHPVQRFGYPAVEKHGRFVKGDTSGQLFACGSLDGRVRLWDLRALKSLPAEILCLEDQKVIQASFAFSSIVALSKDQNISVLRYSMEL